MTCKEEFEGHAQKKVKIGPELVEVDEQLANLLAHLNERVNPNAVTEFSCQGDPDCDSATAYLMLASESSTFLDDCQRLLCQAFKARVGYTVRVKVAGTIPSGLRERTRRITIARRTLDYKGLDATSEMGRWMGYPRIHRLILRWCPEDFAAVESACYDMAHNMRSGIKG